MHQETVEVFSLRGLGNHLLLVYLDFSSKCASHSLCLCCFCLTLVCFFASGLLFHRQEILGLCPCDYYSEVTLSTESFSIVFKGDYLF